MTSRMHGSQLALPQFISALVLAGLLLVAGNAACAETIVGRVVGIADGDTVTVLDASKTQHKIRMAGIDAPEQKMPFGQRAKEHLSDLDRQLYANAENQARSQRVGLWRDDNPTPPWEYRKERRGGQ